jgi:DNA-binding SARP family transcriptional activator/predicted ATPase
MARIRLAFLGPPHVELDGTPVRLDTGKAIALMAYLAVIGKPVSRDALVALLWSRCGRVEGHAALRRTLSAMRNVLGRELMAAEREAVWLPESPHAWIDLLRFRDLLALCGGHAHERQEICRRCLPVLSEAAKLYRGEFLLGFTLKDSAEFDDWRLFTTERYRLQTARVLDRLVMCSVAAGDVRSATSYAHERLGLDPLDEEAHVMLMRVFAWDGNRAAAKHQFEECRRLLKKELRNPPREATARLAESIAQGRTPDPPAFADERGETARGKAPPRPAALKLDAPDPNDEYVADGQTEEPVSAVSKIGSVSAKLAIQLLGDFHITYDDRPVEGFETARLQSILAYLLLRHDFPQPRRQLAYRFWPDSSEPAARNNLRQLIYQLRQALPDPDRFLTGNASAIGWRLDGDQTVDVVVLEQSLAQADTAQKQQNPDVQRYALEQAARAYRGELLPGCYDEWIAPERERLQTMMSSALQKLVTLQEQSRDYAAAIRTSQMLLRLDPLDEALYLQLMRLHRLNHDPAGAIRVYQAAHETLHRELGIQPGQALRSAYENIRRAEAVKTGPARAGRAKAISAQPGQVVHEAQQAASPTPLLSLIGRQAEWQQLREVWQRAANGSAVMVVLSGEAGIGKTRLAEEMALWAEQQGILTARAHAYGVEGRLTLAPVTEWLRDAHFRDGFAALEPIWRVEISRLLPELRARDPSLPRPEPISEYGQRQRFFEALARAILSPARPSLLLLDDMQWCDQETLEWLHFLLRFDSRAPLFILATARSEESQSALARLVQQLRVSGAVAEIELAPLDASETGKLARQAAGEELNPSEAMRLYRETEGNPLFVIEMVRAGFRDRAGKGSPGLEDAYEPAALPPRVQAVILQRLEQLSAEARRAAEIAAVYGQPFTLDLLLQAGHEEEGRLVSALDELWQKRIIREQAANVYEFTHDKLREVAYAGVSAPQRRLLHRRVAQAVEALHEANSEPAYGQIAAHYDQAGAPEKAIPNYEMAGAVAAGVYANEDAIALLNRGLELLQQTPAGVKRDAQELALLLAITPLCRLTKGWTAPELRRALNRALSLCDQVGTPAQRAQILYGLQSMYVVEGRLEMVQSTYEEMRRLFMRTQSSAPQFAGLMVAGARMHLGRLSEARAGFEEIIASHNEEQVRDLQTSQGVNYLVLGQAWDSHGLWCMGFPETALQRALDAVQIARRYAQPFNHALAVTYLAMLQELRTDSDAFRAQAAEALSQTQESHAVYYQQWAQILVDFAEAGDSPSVTCLARLENAIDAFTATGARLRLPYYLSLLARACQQAGEHQKALEVIQRAIYEATRTRERCWDAQLYWLRGEFLLLGPPEEQALAGEAFQRALNVAGEQGALAFELRAAVSLAKLWQAQQPPEVKPLLAPILSRFSEGRQSFEYQTAQKLIDFSG